MHSTATRNSNSYRRGHAQRGLSLFELLVAIIVLAVLMTGISELVVTNTRNANATSAIARMQETGRIAMQVLTADIRRAGFYGGNIYPELIEGTLGLSTLAEECDETATDWGRMLQRPIFGLNDTNAGYESCIPDDDYLRGDILVLRYTGVPAIFDDTEMEDGTPYLRTTMVEGRIFNGLDKAAPANIVNPDIARSYPLTAVAYYIANTGRTCGVDEDNIEFEVPALFRVTLSEAGLPIRQELLAGVEHVQFRYKVGNAYVDADDVPADWAADTVTAVETTVLVRAECPESGFINDRNFDLADIENYGPNDAFRRQVFTSITQVRNAELR